MRRPSVLTWLLLGWTALWFGLVLPGHQRGAVLLPGSGSDGTPQVATASGCAACTRSAPPQTSDLPLPPPSGGRCALCHLMAVLDAPAAVAIHLPPWTLIDWLTPTAAANLIPLTADRPHAPRGPPWL